MQTPSEQEMKAYFEGKPVSPEFLAKLESQVEALLEGLEAAAKSFEPAPAAADSQPTEQTER
jgi:hypothetical protein